jgi:hypothetical protein
VRLHIRRFVAQSSHLNALNPLVIFVHLLIVFNQALREVVSKQSQFLSHILLKDVQNLLNPSFFILFSSKVSVDVFDLLLYKAVASNHFVKLGCCIDLMLLLV